MSTRSGGLEGEIAVVGAGPAGARAAELLAAAGADVVLMDPRAPWEKPCGGGLTESIFLDLPELRELDAESRPIRTIRLETAPDRGFSVPLDQPIRVVSREALGRWQLDRARSAGAVHRPLRVRSIRRDAGRWRLETDETPVTARLLVGADGAASRVRPVVAPGFRVELAPTRVSFVPGAGPTPDDILLRLFTEDVGYLWDFPRPDHRSVGVFVQSEGWQRPRMDGEIEAFRRSAETCRCADEEADRAGAVIGTAWFGHGDFSPIGGRDFALLGDAAGLADPATGEGIRNALRSAEMLATAWSEGSGFRAYPELARRGFRREFALSRLLRRIVCEGDGGARLVEGGRRSDGLHALTVALAGAVNEHDASPTGFARRWWNARARIRREPASAGRDERTPAPCGHAGSAADSTGSDEPSLVEGGQEA